MIWVALYQVDIFFFALTVARIMIQSSKPKLLTITARVYVLSRTISIVKIPNTRFTAKISGARVSVRFRAMVAGRSG